jgi:hypothetical protein
MPTPPESARRNVILYRTHFWDRACAREFAALSAALGGTHDLFVIGYLTGARPSPPAEIAQVWHRDACLAELSYPGQAALKPAHLTPMKFFRDHPGYDHYWLIEYDVRYTGDWAALLTELAASPADLLATVIQRRAENPDWPLWPSLAPIPDRLRRGYYVKAFTPLMRLSNAAFRAIDAVYRAGWTGHYEALWPTAIAAAGLGIEEIGGAGRFTPPSRHGKYYTNNRLHAYLPPGSFIFRPSFLECEIPREPPGLWHPVKSAAMRETLPPPPPPDWREHPSLKPVRRLRRWLRQHGIIGNALTRQRWQSPL